MSWGYGWRPYVPVAVRQAKAAKYATQLAKKKKRTLNPIKLDGRNIACTFWGKAWCENLERYSDFANRLPRGRSYVRNGSVIDLQIDKGTIKALVSGSEVYRVTITIDTLKTALWKRILADCSQSISSLLDLLQGRFDEGVMARLTERETGLFPQPKEISIKCSCPDWAVLCKHAAAVLYGVGARLDSDPEFLFTLRHVDHLELVGAAASAENLDRSLKSTGTAELAGDLGEIFGINLDAGEPTASGEANSNPKPKKRKASPTHVDELSSKKPQPKRPSGTLRTSPKPAAPKKLSTSKAVVAVASRQSKMSKRKSAG